MRVKAGTVVALNPDHVDIEGLMNRFRITEDEHGVIQVEALGGRLLVIPVAASRVQLRVESYPVEEEA